MGTHFMTSWGLISHPSVSRHGGCLTWSMVLLVQVVDQKIMTMPDSHMYVSSSLILQGMVGFWFNSHFTEIVSINCLSSKKNLVTHHSTKNYQLYIHPPILFLLLGFVSKNKKTKNQTTTKTKTKKLHLFALPGWTATVA